MSSDEGLPKFSGLKIYPFDEMAMVNFANNAVMVPLVGGNGHFGVKPGDTIRVSGNIIFGIETSEVADGGIKTGVNKIKLYIDGVQVFDQKIDRFAFAETRYVNSIIDYPALVQHGRRIQRSYIAPNNRINVFHDVKNRGIVNFNDSKVHRVKYVVADAFDHTSELTFTVKSHPPPGSGGRPENRKIEEKNPGIPLFSCKTDNEFQRNNLKFSLPKEAIYDDLDFIYKEMPSVSGTYSALHKLQDNLTPLHTWCDLKIKCENLPVNLNSKALIVMVVAPGKFASAGGKWESGWVSTRIREFGSYAVAIDTEPPVIKPVNIAPNKKISRQTTIRVTVSDNLSGVDSYRGTLNGKWILMDYDLKSRSLTYIIDDHLKPGKNQFSLTVTDAMGNSSKYNATLLR